MQQSQVDRLPTPATFLTVTDAARAEINRIGREKPQGAFRVRCDIGPKVTEVTFAWDDQFTPADFMIDIDGLDYEIVMDATTIAYILDEYTLDYIVPRFNLSRNAKGPLRHQTS